MEPRVLLAAGLAGAALNFLRLEAAGGAAVTFGGVPALLIALTGRPGLAAAVALTAGIPSLFGFGEMRWALLHVLEAAGLAVLARRMSGLPAALLLWTAALAPAAIVLRMRDLDPSGALVWLQTMVLMLNGLVNTVIAEHLVRMLGGRAGLEPAGGLRGLSLRSILASSMVGVVALPLLLLTAVSSRAEVERNRSEAQQRMNGAAAIMRAQVDDYLGAHMQAVISLAGLIEETGTADQARIARMVERTHLGYPAFESLRVIPGPGQANAWLSQSGTKISIGAPAGPMSIEGRIDFSTLRFLDPALHGLPEATALLADSERRVVFSSRPADASVAGMQAESVTRDGGLRVVVRQPDATVTGHAARNYLRNNISALLMLLFSIPVAALLA